MYGRVSVILRGLKDGGAAAAQIGDTNIAKEHNGSTIFNVNHPSNECFGGHYHDPSDSANVLFQNCYFSRFGNVIENTWLLAEGKPSNVSGHTICLSSPYLKKIGVNCSSPSTFSVGVYVHDTVTYTLITTISLVNQISLDKSISVNLTKGLQLAMVVLSGTAQEIDASLIVAGN